MTLKEIRNKNKNSNTLLAPIKQEATYSRELISQCKDEFEAFVKPIRNSVISRNLNK